MIPTLIKELHLWVAYACSSTDCLWCPMLFLQNRMWEEGLSILKQSEKIAKQSTEAVWFLRSTVFVAQYPRLSCLKVCTLMARYLLAQITKWNYSKACSSIKYNLYQCNMSAFFLNIYKFVLARKNSNRQLPFSTKVHSLPKIYIHFSRVHWFTKCFFRSFLGYSPYDKAPRYILLALFFKCENWTSNE